MLYYYRVDKKQTKLEKLKQIMADYSNKFSGLSFKKRELYSELRKKLESEKAERLSRDLKKGM